MDRQFSKWARGLMRKSPAPSIGALALLCALSVARAEVQDGVQFAGPAQTGQLAVDLAGTVAATEDVTGIVGIYGIPVQTLVIEVVDGPVQSDFSPATAATDCDNQPSAGATIETGSSGELVDVRNMVVELFSSNSVNLAIQEFELSICLTESCRSVGEVVVKVNADADVNSMLFCQAGSAALTPTGAPDEYQVSVSGKLLVTGEWRAPLRISGIPIPLSDDYDFEVPITLTGVARLTSRGLVLDLSALANPSIRIEYDVAVELEDDPPLIVDADGYLIVDAQAGLGLAVHLQSFSNIVEPPETGFPFEVTRLANVDLLTQDRIAFDADFDGPIPSRDDDVVISLDGQEIFREKFRSFRKEIFGDDVYRSTSLLGLDVFLNFDDGELVVRGYVRPKLDADLADGLTVRLDLGGAFGADTIEIDKLLGVLWTIGECSLPGVVDGDSCARGDGVCEAGFCTPIGLCADVDCNDQNDCTADKCDPGSGSCNFFVKREGTSCNLDTGSCDSLGNCIPNDGCTGVSCDDGNECTDDLCDPADGSCSHQAAADGTVCSGGACTGGECVNICSDDLCNDGESCTFDLCDPVNGACLNANKPANFPCSFGVHPGSCAGACDLLGAPGDCVCEPLAGCCAETAGPCQTPVCTAEGCGTPTNKADGTVCGEGLVCTSGVCAPIPNVCDGVECDQDPNDCVVSSCFDDNGTPACAEVNRPANDDCLFGVHPGLCDGNGACDAVSGCCEPTGPCQRPVCTDQPDPNECGVPTNEPDGTVCGEGLVCSGGECVPTDPCAGVECPGDECNAGVCGLVGGQAQCGLVPLSDGTVCGPGTCEGGVCQVGDPFDVTSFSNVRLLTQDRVAIRADFEAAVPSNDDRIIITLDGQEIFNEKFRSFRSGLLGDSDVYNARSLLGLDVTLDFGDGELRVSGTVRPKLDEDAIDDGLTVTLQIGPAFQGTDTIPISVFLGTLWTLDE